MSDAESPAVPNGGNTAVPNSDSLADLPARIRVHALAKLLGSSSKELLKKLSDMGEATRSAQSSVSRDVALRVANTGSAVAEKKPIEHSNAPLALATARPVASAHTAVWDTGGGGKESATNTASMPIFAAPSPIFLPPQPQTTPKQKSVAPKPEKTSAPDNGEARGRKSEDLSRDEVEADGRRRRRRGRRGRGRGKGSEDYVSDAPQQAGTPVEKTDGHPDTSTKTDDPEAQSHGTDIHSAGENLDNNSATDSAASNGEESSAATRRRRRRRRKGDDESTTEQPVSQDDPPNTVVHVREPKAEESKPTKGDGVRSVRGSTRLEAKRQRRRDGREAGRRRAPILSEAEFLARREAVERTMVVAENGSDSGGLGQPGTTQIGVLEDGVLVEHFVTSSNSGSIVGNVYLGRVQNVLPSMEAAFVDIGRGRNAVLYAGEVDWDAAGLEGKSRKIEQALSTGDHVVVQVTKDPVGHKGARLTTQVSLPGRFLVYVPGGGATGISRKLPENERRRLKDVLKRIVPEDAGVIIRTASEGVTEEELDRDVRRLQAQWNVIAERADKASAKGKKSGAPIMLYEEPDLLVKVVRDLFTEDFVKLEVQGETAWETIHAYVQHVAPDLVDRLKRYTGTGSVFADYRIDEQLAKALDRKVWLPSGGYLVIDRTEAMTVIDVNTGKFTGSGGNLEETVTRNNLESAEEIVRQLRLRDIGGIIVIDFIDMVLEANRELVLRRLTECLGRDRTRHQVAEVTSLGLVQMTRKRIGTGLLEAFSTTCEHCKGRGVIVSTATARSVNTDETPAAADSHDEHRGHRHDSRNARARAKRSDRMDKAGKPSNNSGNNASPNVSSAESAAETPAAPTAEQRESVTSAVQAIANATKSATETSAASSSLPLAEPQSESPAAAGSTSSSITDAETAQAIETAQATEAATVGESPQVNGHSSAGNEPAVARGRRRPRRSASRPAGPPITSEKQASA